MSIFKVLANQTTALDAELFAIRPDIAKVTIMDIECIITITDSLKMQWTPLCILDKLIC